jgi:hypothetical protein
VKAKLKPNFTFMIAYSCCMGIGTFNAGWNIAGHAQTAPIIIAKFGWNEQEAILYNTYISASPIVGLTIGTLLVGRIIVNGRRRAGIISDFIAMVGCLITQYLSVPTLCLGRFLIGFSSAISIMVMGKSNDETIPQEWVGVFNTQLKVYVCFA